MRPQKKTEAHKTDKFAELVCSNSFRSSDHEKNAVGQLKWELNKANSFILENADLNPSTFYFYCKRSLILLYV